MGQMSANIRAKGVAAVARLMLNGFSPQNLEVLRSPATVVAAFERTRTRIHVRWQGHPSPEAFFNYETNLNTSLGDFLAYTKTQMNLGANGEDLSLIPGVTLSTLMKDLPGMDLASAVTQTNSPLQGIIYSSVGSPDGAIWLHPGDALPERRLTAGEWPRLSPDARQLIFHRGNPDSINADLYLRDLVTGVETQVVTNEDEVAGYSWLQDSSQIVFDNNCGINVMSRDGSNPSPAGSNPHQILGVSCFDEAPAVNPVSGVVAFHNSQSGLGLADYDPANLALAPNRRLIPNTQPGDRYPAWSADGQWIAFADGANYFKIRPDGSARTALTHFAKPRDGLMTAVWTPDGANLIVADTLGGTNGLFAIPTDGSAAVTPIPGVDGPGIDFVGTVLAGSLTGLTDLPVIVAHNYGSNVIVHLGAPDLAGGEQLELGA